MIRRTEGEGTFLEILNVGLGDLKLTFNKHSTTEREQAQRTIERLMREGYAILIEQADGTYVRAKSFDAETDSYVIMEPEPVPVADEAKPKRRGRPKKVARSEVNATAVARSAGG